MPQSTRNALTGTLGLLFCRLLIPGWLLTGALFKLYYRSPRNLPRSIWEPMHKMGVDLDLLLRCILGVEFLIVGVLLFSSRFARLMAIALMTVFCLILLNEIRSGATSCGCLGEVTMPPYVMLAIDVPLLLGALFFKPRPYRAVGTSKPIGLKPWTAVFALSWILASFAAAFGVPEVKVIEETEPQVVTTLDDGDTGGTTDETTTGQEPKEEGPVITEPLPIKPPPLQRPKLPSYYVLDTDELIGKRWEDLEIASYIDGTPTDVNVGRRYVIIYNPTCDHCYDLLSTHFYGELPVPTTVVAMPESKQGFATEGVYDMPCDTCERLKLRIGCDWLISPPAVIALEDGVVVCAVEQEDVVEPQCLRWHEF